MSFVGRTMPRDTASSGSVGGRDDDAQPLGAARQLDGDRFRFRVVGDLRERFQRAHGLSVGDDDAVAGAQACRGRGRSGQDAADERLGPEPDSCASDRSEFTLLPLRRQHRLADGAAAVVQDLDRRAGIHRDDQSHVVEVGDRLAFGAHDAIARLKACLRARLSRRDLGDHRIA